MEDFDFFGDDLWGEEPEWAKSGEDGDGGGGGDDGTNNVVGAQHVLLLVDCHSNMFVQIQNNNNNDEGDDVSDNAVATTTTPFDMALCLAQELLQRCIRTTVTSKTGKRNGVGLLLYHTKPNRTESKKNDDNDEEEDAENLLEEDSEDEDNENATTVHVLLPLSPPGVSQVQTIRSCVPNTKNKKERDLQQEFACNDDKDMGRIAPLQTALEESMRVFRKAKCVKATKPAASSKKGVAAEQMAVDSKSIWIFTNRDNPYPSYSSLIQNVARDAREEGIQIELWPLPSKQQHLEEDPAVFDHDAFFESITSRPPTFPERFQSAEDLHDCLDDLQEYFKKIRRSYYGPMVLPDWREQQAKSNNDSSLPIMIDWFQFVQLAKKPGTVTIDQQTKRETIKVKQFVDQDNEIFATLKPQGTTEEKSKPQPGLKRLRQYASFGGQLVSISNQDKAELRHESNGKRLEASLTILGFKPIDSIPMHHTMDKAYLIYPNDDAVQGSRAAFEALHTSMLHKNVLAVGEALLRITWSSKLVAIYPLEEEISQEDGGRQKRPPCMMVCTLPFEDNLRELEVDAATKEYDLGKIKKDEPGDGPDDVPSNMDLDGQAGNDNNDDIVTGNVASQELVDAAVDLIGCQRLEGMELGDDFYNAALEDFFNYLEAVALELPQSSEEEEYDTRPDDDMILGVAREQIEAFLQRLPEDAAVKPKKRAAAKRKVVPDESGIDWEELYRSDELDTCKVDQLKSFLRSKGESTTGRKAALVQAVATCLAAELEKKTGKKKVKLET